MKIKIKGRNFGLIVGVTFVLITIMTYSMIYSHASTQSGEQNQGIYSKLQNKNQNHTGCSSDWYVTGYFTPNESDYSGGKKTIYVQGAGTLSFYNSFLKDVRIEGGGETRFGWYVADHGNGWTKISYARTASGEEAKAGVSIATDPNVIPTGTNGITVRTLPSPWNTYQFRAVDTGPDIIGKHIDVYTGIGAAADKESYRITGYGNTVCIS
ncbi:MAG: 3D domain-containing protein [Thermoproteota archaeon]|nr:3D domain-containing protein [Thermoproteota archaeon]